MTNGSEDLRVVPLDAGVYEVQLHAEGGPLRIGRVSSPDGQRTWAWQHRDGERSSPVEAKLGDVVRALADYHRAFKALPAPVPVHRLLFND
jgi:hypothetical protein